MHSLASENLVRGINDRLAPLPISKISMISVACLLALGVANAAEDYKYVVAPGDTLAGIAQALLKDPNNWSKVQRLNQIEDPRRLRTGASLRIPLALMRLEATPGKISSVKGEVSIGGKPAEIGASVPKGAQVVTGNQSFVTVDLVDGSRLVLQPSSRMKVEEMSRYQNTSLPDTKLRLDSGRVESVVTKMNAPRPQYTIITPTATIGVRGTQFRVGAIDANEASKPLSQTEVTNGLVTVQSAKGKATPVPAGFGVIADPSGKVSAPVELLNAPDTNGIAKVQEKPVLRLSVPPIAGASGYRFQIATDPEMRNVVTESSPKSPEAKFAELADGDYTLRVRGVDAKGLEGRDADVTFKLKARPEAPFAVAPSANSKVRGDTVELNWSANADAARYRIQLADNKQFANPIVDLDGVDGTVVTPAQKMVPGEYFWRTRSIRSDGDLGPWSDPLHFTLKPPPAEPEPAQLDDKTVSFSWSSEPDQTFLFQFAKDDKFSNMMVEQKLDKPTISFNRPEDGGTFYMRVQATDPDGFVGPFTKAQKIDLPPPSKPWWLALVLLVPALL